MSPSDFHVGQSLLFVGSANRRTTNEIVTVTHVGRKWVSTSKGMRFAPPNMRADGNRCSSPGTFWLSEADYKAHRASQDAWMALRRFVADRYEAPGNLSAESITEAFRILRGEK